MALPLSISPKLKTLYSSNMKTIFISICCFSLVFTATGQNKEGSHSRPDPTKKIQIVEAACGECQLRLDGNSCDLAVRIDGKSYFVDGTDIDSHGDPHAKEGFCKAIRKAEVQGEIVGNRFKVTYFKLINPPVKDTKNKN
jgi:hypothetical protein